MTDSLCDRLRAGCLPVWESLHQHPFLLELAAGTLPGEKFRFYVEQNLMYLPEYSRALALGAANSRDSDELSAFTASLRNIVETEIPENEARLGEIIELGAEDRGGTLAMAPANLAYTSYLLAAAFRGGPLEVMTAIMPCAWSYGEIAAGLDLDANDHPVYRSWIAFFASDEYAEIVDGLKAKIESFAAAGRFDEGLLLETFRNGARLELGFWEMAYTFEQWPDLTLEASVA
ncbi:MAG: thiaminase II [Actinobacteria bacterium]|nr:thiaminase II [Actinomycetota bacterium]